MPYVLARPPVPLSFEPRDHTLEELQAYGTWFHAAMPERIAALEREVRTTPGFSNWVADDTPASLDALGEWFATEAAYRFWTEDETASYELKMGWRLMAPQHVLTDRTLSLAFDIGMYLGRLLNKEDPTLAWRQKLKGGKRYFDYGHVVLARPGDTIPLELVGSVVTFAHGATTKYYDGTRLKDIYWSRAAPWLVRPVKPMRFHGSGGSEGSVGFTVMRVADPVYRYMNAALRASSLAPLGGELGYVPTVMPPEMWGKVHRDTPPRYVPEMRKIVWGPMLDHAIFVRGGFEAQLAEYLSGIGRVAPTLTELGASPAQIAEFEGIVARAYDAILNQLKAEAQPLPPPLTVVPPPGAVGSKR